MKAIHVIWSEPSFTDTEFQMEDHELLTMVLSALAWREYNGAIKIVADRKVIDYFENIGLITLWDDGNELLSVEHTFSPQTFWAAGKIFALRQQTEPVAIIDHDFIAWKSVEPMITREITTAHQEQIHSVYPPETYFKMDDTYSFKQFSWEVFPYNTAFLYIRDTVFKDYYVSQSINFMRHCCETANDVCSMVFAEQRLLSMCAEQWKQEIGVLMDHSNLNKQKMFTHIWGYKQVLRKNAYKRKLFCRRCADRIMRDYPEMALLLSKISIVSEYFRPIADAK